MILEVKFNLKTTTEKEKKQIKEVMDKTRFNLILNCDKCGKEDSIDSLSDLCFDCLKKMKGGLIDMGYSIYQDMEKVNNSGDWENHGRQILNNSCNHDDGVENEGWCEKCDISEDSATPMMNFLYPLELKDFDDNKVLKVVKETNCTVLENTETGEWFLALCGGGMDLSQDIAFSYQILETWLPQDFLRNVAKQPLLSLGNKNYKALATGIIKQLKTEAVRNREKANEWRESLRNLRKQEKEKKQ